MAKQQKSGQANVPSKGLNRDSWSLGEADYVHLQNGNFDNFDGGTFTLTNEMSNILSSKFKTGFKVIGFINDLNTENTYFFLTNPTTKVSEFGVIKSNQNNSDLDDLVAGCDECGEIKELAVPLETLTQIELQTYTTLITDLNCDNGFNFDINFPIKSPVIKDEKCGKTIYFTDNLNPSRYINIDRIADYFIDDVSCGDDLQLECPDFSKMLIFKQFSIPRLIPISIELGGNLKMGVYQFLVAYCDALGNEISEYYSITNPVSIFDRNSIILEQPQLADRTSFSIKLKMEGLDNKYTHYKVAVIQTADIDFTDRYFIEGVHTIDDTTVIYSSEVNKTSTSVHNLSRYNLKVGTTEGMTTSNNILFQYGITNKKEINLQPVVNFMGQFVKWQTHIAPEDLYENGIAVSLFKGYNRDEVVPFGIKFLLNGGYETAIFPFIARAPEETDLEYVVETDVDGNLIPLDGNQDVASILANTGDCNTTDRTRRWQYYNTAELDPTGSACGTNELDTIDVTEEITRFCVVEDIATIPTNTISLLVDTEFTTLENYISDNTGESEAECSEAYSDLIICEYLYADYSAVDCLEDPFNGLSCGAVTTVSEVVEVQEVIGEVVTKIEKDFADDYVNILPPSTCYPYSLNTVDGALIPDTALQAIVGQTPIYVREGEFFNETCEYATEIISVQNPISNTGISNYNNYYYSSTLSDLYTSKNSTITATGFYTNIHKGGIWSKGDIGDNTKFILDFSIQKDSTTNDYFDTLPQIARMSIFKSCSTTTAIYSDFIDLSIGERYLLEKVGADLKITKEDGTTITTIVNGWFTTKKLFIVVDNSISYEIGGTTPTYLITPTKGCYTVSIRDIEYSRIDVTWDSIILKKKIELKSTCVFQEPVVKACRAVPYKKGNFAYWESSQTYPDNNELFNSSLLKITSDDIPEEIKNEFESLYVDTILGGEYIWKKDVNEKEISDFTCRNIRHFKFPDNKIAPFIYEGVKIGFSSSVIFPMGVTIDETVINTFLDVAENNGLLTSQDRANITAYEIVRGNLASNRSVVASGLLYDTRKYQEKEGKDKYLLYSNYPYNSYSEDKFNEEFIGENREDLGEGAVWGLSNRNYTFHSPETDYSKPTIPSEISVQAYMYGQSKTFFDEVKDHPKWVILTDKARNLANTLAFIEVGAEILIQSLMAASSGNSWAFAGFSGVGGSLAIESKAAAAAILGIGALEAVVSKYGKYRYEWLGVFKNLGSPTNFAYYSFSEGNYNTVQNLQTEGNLVRGINVGKYLKDGRFTNTNEVTAEKLEINNIDRERSVFLSTGKFPIVYPTTYSTYDRESLTYSGENGISEVGRSSEVIKNIASPYVALKNYLVEQHGTINSINWLSTGYRGDLTNPQTSCIAIFGGDTFITRHTLKRKHSQFLVTSMKQADMTPFNYYFYNNIGRKPKFWISYDIDKDFESRKKLFPDIVTEKSFDNETKGGNYYRPPSKFYLYHYGIPSFLCETRINTNLRYAGNDLKEHFYPQVGDIGEWTQEVNVPIRTPNSFKYNSVYSKNVTPLKQRNLSINYNKNLDECKADFPNGVIYSLPDNSENSSFDPWLINRPLDFYEFPTSYGKLKELRGIESAQVLARFENTTAIFNAVDTIVDDGKRPETQFLGNGGIFARRPVTYSETDLGYGGTQTSASVSCEFGHYHVDAKRGQVIEVQNGGKGIQEISSFTGDSPSGMRNWFKEHLPFKILKSGINGIENANTDNAYNGVGITMGWDSRFRRVFITKKDYIPKKDKCIEYDINLGFVTNETECLETPQISSCPEGYTYNRLTGMCEETLTSSLLCPDGYTYNEELGRCTLIETVNATCVCTADVFASPETICSGTITDINLTSTETGISYTWTAIQSGVTGATAGSGNTISQTLSNSGITSGTATYTITPYETISGCLGTPIEVVVTVKPIPNVIATPSSLSISDGDTATINLTSNIVGTTFTWTAINTGTTGAISGSGNTISQIITGEGTATYTITPTNNGCNGIPIDVIVTVAGLVISNNTKINIWFDNSGSMNSTLTPLQTMASTILKPCLLPAYNNDSALYDSRVEVLNFSSNADSFERYIKLLAKTSTDPVITKVINITFADESNVYGAEVAYGGTITAAAASDIASLRSTLSTEPANSLFGVAFQVATGGVATPAYPGFRTFVTNVHTGVAPFTGTNGLSDKTEIGYELDVIPGDTPQYYANLIIDALNNLGFTLTPC